MTGVARLLYTRTGQEVTPDMIEYFKPLVRLYCTLSMDDFHKTIVILNRHRDIKNKSMIWMIKFGVIARYVSVKANSSNQYHIRDYWSTNLSINQGIIIQMVGEDTYTANPDLEKGIRVEIGELANLNMKIFDLMPKIEQVNLEIHPDQLDILETHLEKFQAALNNLKSITLDISKSASKNHSTIKITRDMPILTKITVKPEQFKHSCMKRPRDVICNTITDFEIY
jgi:hypothetical protein